MGTSLTGKNISASYLGLIKTTDNAVISATAKRLTDGNGTDSSLYLSTTSLGIGGTPLTKLHIQDNDVSITPNASQYLAVENNGNTAIGIFSSTTGQGSIDFGDSGDTNAGRILYEHNDNALRFSTNGSSKMSILSDGKIGIGTSTVSSSAFMEIKGVGSLSTAIVKLMPSDASSTTALYNAFDGGDNAMSQYGTVSGDTILQHIASSGELKLRVNGTTGLTMNQSQNIKLDAYGGGTITGTATQRLGVDSSGNVIEIPIGGGAVDGSGTANTVTMWSDTDTITDAPITISGNNSTFAGNVITSGNILINEDRIIARNTSDGSDSGTISLTGGGDASSSRGAYLQVFGNEHSSLAGQVRLVAGNVANAELRINAVSATGFITNYVGGSERMRLDSSGRLGLGTSSPASKIDVREDANNVYTGYFYNSNTGSTAHGINVQTASTDADAYAFRVNSASNSNALVVKGDANVGIGTSSPDALLNLESSTPALRITDTDSNAPYELKVDGGTFSIEEVSNSRTLMSMTTGAVITLDSLGSNTVLNTTGSVVVPNGSVGIGTTSPSQKLHVVGKALITDDVQLTGSSPRIDFNSNGSDALRFYDTTNATERMRITSGGKVGISTTNAIMPLTIKGDVSRNAIAIFNSGSGTEEGILYWYSSDETTIRAGISGNENGLDFKTGSSATNRMRIDSSGNVGIGTTSPVSKFETKDGDVRVTTLNSFSKFKSGRASIPSSGGFNLGGLHFEAYSTGTTYTTGSAIESYADGSAWTSTSTPSYLSFQTVASGSTSLVERMRIDSAGNSTFAGDVTVQGGDILNASGNFTITSASDFIVDASNNISLDADGGLIKFLDAGSEKMRLDSSGDLLLGNTVVNPASGFSNQKGLGYDTSAGVLEVASTTDTVLQLGRNQATDGDVIAIRKQGTVVGVIGTQNWGIGTASPDNTLDVVVSDVNVTPNAESSAVFRRNGNNYLSILSNSSNVGGILFGNEADSIDGAIVYNHSDQALIFETADSERMRITSSGEILKGITSAVGVGGTPADANSTEIGNGYIILARDDTATAKQISFGKNGSEVGSIETTGSATSYNTSSDYRLKEDLKDFNALDIASKIKMYDFKWKADDSRSYGVMAHELQEVLPQAVSGEKDAEEMQSVDYSKLVPILLKSIQELKAEIDELKKNK